MLAEGVVGDRGKIVQHASIYFSTHGLRTAHVSSPLVAMININTIASSFLESLSA
jgi:hypothetical protein